MLLRLELLRQNCDLSAKAREEVAELEAETSRARFLTRYLMALTGRPRVAKPEVLDLGQITKKVLAKVGPLMARNTTFRFEPSPDKIWILGEATSIEDLVANLCLHPAHAALCDGELVLKTGLVVFENKKNLRAKKARTGPFVCLTLTETWRGTEPAEVAANENKRHELALLPLEEFARQNQGWVEAKPVGGNGFTIQVFLPMAKPPSDWSAEPQPSEEVSGDETILLVDDEAILRRVTALSLRKLGYAVLEAANEEQARQSWEAHHQSIDLLFTDMMLPGDLTGLELARQLRRKNQALKVIVASGYKITDQEQVRFNQENITFLTKPYSTGETARTVRRCLDHRPQIAD